MKTLMCVVMALTITIGSYASNGFDKLYEKYSGNDNVTSMNLSESMLKLGAKFMGDDDQEAKDLLNSIKTIKLIVSEGKEKSSIGADARNILSSEGYEELIRVNDGDEIVRVMVKESNTIIKDIIVYVDSSDELVFINITGDIDPEKVGKALKSLDIKVDGLNIE